MKLISLNTWGGRLLEPLLKFIENRSADTDIFCFQEVFMGKEPESDANIRLNLLDEMKKVLPDFSHYSHLAKKGGEYFINSALEVPYGIAVFVKKSIEVSHSGGDWVWQKELIPEEIFPPTNGNFLHIELSGHPGVVVGNFHGFVTFKSGKGDTPIRKYQAERVMEFYQKQPDIRKQVLIGDFNLRPEAESIKIFEEKLRNLVKEYNIQTTRNSNYKNMEKYKDYIADYCFVSPNVEVVDFKVLPDTVSDHQPLFLDFS